MGDWLKQAGLSGAAAARVRDSLAALPDAEDAEGALERLFAAAGERGAAGIAEAPLAREGLVRLAFAAPFLLRHLTRHPHRLREGLLDALDAPPTLLPWRDYPAGDPTGAADDADLMRRLRLWKYDNYVRITAGELLALHETAATCALISQLAEEMIRVAYRHAFAGQLEKYGLPLQADGRPAVGVVVGMGKLGGGELNYASDVDLIIIHDADDRPCVRPPEGAVAALRGAVSEAEAWAPLADVAAVEWPPSEGRAISGGEFHNRLAREVVRLLSAPTTEGIGFRVDLDLRPQGRSGLPAPALGFLQQYYDAQGREWERTALLKARRVAGSEPVAARFFEAVRPFVYRRYLDFSALEGIALVKHDIDRTHGGAMAHDLKLGPGGIRENEFFAQALQLLYGGKRPELQVTGHAAALARLAAAGVVSEADGAQHEADYWLLRGVENRLQMVEEHQTHELPEPGPARRRVLTGFDAGGVVAAEEMEARLAAARERTAARFGGLFAVMDAEVFPDSGAWRAALQSHLPEAEAAAAVERVNRLLNHLMETRVGERCVVKVSRLLAREAVYARGTEAALPRWLDFLDQIGNRNAILTLIDSHPPLVEMVSRIFTEGGVHAEGLLRHPQFLETFLAGGESQVPDPLHTLRELPETARDMEEFILEMQTARAQEVIRILAGYLDDPHGTRHRERLSDLAQRTVELCARFAWRELLPRFGHPSAGEEELMGFAVLAMGKLGSREMRFASDLDLVFVYGADGQTRNGFTDYEFYTRLAQKVSSLLTAPTQFGKLYELDHRLRPFGAKGVLVPTLAAFQAFAGEAEVWNFQAFTRIRHLCGEARLSAALVDAMAEGWRARRPADGEVARRVREMAVRLVVEHGPSPRAEGPPLALKYAMGGMIGFEFLRQFHFLRGQPRVAGTPWAEPAWPEALKALQPAYDTLGALDERLSFHVPKFDHLFLPAHCEGFAAIGAHWRHNGMRDVAAALELAVNESFDQAEQGS